MAEFNSYLLGKVRKISGKHHVVLHEREEHRQGEGVLPEGQPDTGDPGATGEDESAGAVIPAVVAGDPERLCRDR